jgi:hypothetical protein
MLFSIAELQKNEMSLPLMTSKQAIAQYQVKEPANKK